MLPLRERQGFKHTHISKNKHRKDNRKLNDQFLTDVEVRKKLLVEGMSAKIRE